MIAVDLANAVFLICAAAGGLALLVGTLLDDELRPLLAALRLQREVHGVPVVAYVLAFVAGFGIGGLVGTSLLNAEAIPATGVGVVGGLLGIVAVWFKSDARTSFKASARPEMDLDDLVGHRGRVSSPVGSNTMGTVSVIYGGAEREFAATATSDIPVGSLVVVDDVDEAASTLAVTLASHTVD